MSPATCSSRLLGQSAHAGLVRSLHHEFCDSGHWSSSVGSRCRVVISDSRVSSVLELWEILGSCTLLKSSTSLKSCPRQSSGTDSDLSFREPQGSVLRHSLRTCCFLALGCCKFELSRLGSPALHASRRVRNGSVSQLISLVAAKRNSRLKSFSRGSCRASRASHSGDRVKLNSGVCATSTENPRTYRTVNPSNSAVTMRLSPRHQVRPLTHHRGKCGNM